VFVAPNGTPPMPRERTAYVHAGTHKTGTTTIQRFLASQPGALARDGIAYPRSGRLRDALPGHHRLVPQLRPGAASRPDLEALAAELAATGAPRVVISSEGFCSLPRAGDALRDLAGVVARAGYALRTIVYVRAPDDLLESHYASLTANGWIEPFGAVHAEALAHGTVVSPIHVFRYAYPLLVDELAAGAGADAVTVRGYRPGAAPALLEDVLDAVGGAPAAAAAARAGAPEDNPRPPTGWLVERLYDTVANQSGDPAFAKAGRALVASDPAAAAQPFAPLAPEERARFAARFAGDCAAIVRRWGVAPATFVSVRSCRPETPLERRARELFAEAERRLRPVVETLPDRRSTSW
jgi:hypothetical protein